MAKRVQFDRSIPGESKLGLLRTRQTRPRALSMMPLTRSASQDEIGYEKAPLLSSRSKQSSSRQSRHKYYPLSQEETLELLYLLNQAFVPILELPPSSEIPPKNSYGSSSIEEETGYLS
ncbi:unnamed protein product [Cylicocyclus nassatus]|uniref:Uncharacterized protein n=1 Tax=Cylicocyclus nassatus TaxID=53992 RepID=A0AA36ME39_CYLNA|nr:unnamed protein product [Cylicocyclus nassatus]